MRRRVDVILCVTFVGMLGLPAVDTVLRVDPNPVYFQGPAPEWPSLPRTLRDLRVYVGNAKWYLTERYGMKGALLHWHGLLKVKVLGVSSTPRVVLGKGEWLFLSGDALESHYRRRPFAPGEMESWRSALAARASWLRARGVEYVVAVVPGKASVYPEYLPSVLPTPSHGPSRLDELIRAMEALGPDSPILDLRPTLEAAKTDGLVFHATDTHWTARGAGGAAAAILARMGVTPANAFPTDSMHRSGDLARMLSVEGPWADVVVPAAPVAWGVERPIRRMTEQVTSVNADGPVAVVFMDSFGDALLPLLGASLGETHWLWTGEPGGFSGSLVERVRPHVVVQLFTERWLYGPAPRPGL